MRRAGYLINKAFATPSQTFMSAFRENVSSSWWFFINIFSIYEFIRAQLVSLVLEIWVDQWLST